MEPQIKIKVDTLFDKCCKKIDKSGLPKLIHTVFYITNTSPSRIAIKASLSLLLMIL